MDFNFISKLKIFFTKKEKEKEKEKDNIVNITDPYRINRIIRSEWNSGNCKQINQFHHYWVRIDGIEKRFGIVEILNAIEALKKHENKKEERNI